MYPCSETLSEKILSNVERIINFIRDYLDSDIDYKKYLEIFIIVALFIITSIFYNQSVQKNKIIGDLEDQNIELNETYNVLMNTTEVFSKYYTDLLENYQILKSNYEDVQKVNVELQSYLKNIQDDYSKLEEEYALIVSEKETLRAHAQTLQQELSQIHNLEKYDSLIEDTQFVIAPGDNLTLSYEEDYVGFIVLNFSSSSEVVIWVGSSIRDDLYFARIPSSFPKTAVGGSYVIPMCKTAYVYIWNPSESLTTNVTLSITFFY